MPGVSSGLPYMAVPAIIAVVHSINKETTTVSVTKPITELLVKTM